MTSNYSMRYLFAIIITIFVLIWGIAFAQDQRTSSSSRGSTSPGTRSSRSGSTDAPAAPKGDFNWQLVSASCDFGLEELGDSAKVLEWNGEEYIDAQKIEAGRGYVIPAGDDWPNNSVCPGKKGPENITYRKGWNLVGEFANYSKTSGVFRGYFGTGGGALKAMYGLENGNYKKLGSVKEMVWDVGYWAYFDQETSLNGIDKIEISLRSDAGWTLTSGHMEINSEQLISITAYIKVYRNGNSRYSDYFYLNYGGIYNQYDGRYGELELISSNPEVLSINDGEMRAWTLAKGDSELTARIGDYTSDPLTVNVLDEGCKELLVLHKKSFSSYSTTLQHLRRRDDPNRPYMNWSDWDEWIDTGGGDIEFSSAKVSLPSGYQEFSTGGFGSANELQVGLEIPLRAICVYPTSRSDYERQEYVTDEVEWESTDEGIAYVDEDSSSLKLVGRGTVSITAKVKKGPSVKIPIIVESTKVEELFLHAYTKKFGTDNEDSYYQALSYDSDMKMAICTDKEADEGANCYFMQQGKSGGLALFAKTKDGRVMQIRNGIEWMVSDASLAEVGDGNVLTADSTGVVAVKALYQGITSNPIYVRVFKDAPLDFCDPDNENTAAWYEDVKASNMAGWSESNARSRATISTDCAKYRQGEPVNMLFTAQLHKGKSAYNASVCLDLRVKDSNNKLVKTLKYEGCDRLPSAKQVTVDDVYYFNVYEHLGRWDMTNEDGDLVAPGKYYAFAQFNIFYEPIVAVEFEILPALVCEGETPPACFTNMNCDDGNSLTTDICSAPGTCDAACANTACAAACSADSDCDDGDAMTTDICMAAGYCGAYCESLECLIVCGEDADCDDENPATKDTCMAADTCNASCANTACDVACSADADCDDGDELTTDVCEDAGACGAACTHTACDVACDSDSDCDDGDNYTADFCANAGTCKAVCGISSCVVACAADADCDDGNPATADACGNAGTCEAACVNTACDVACSSTADCDDGNYLTTDYCSSPGACGAACENVVCGAACDTAADCDDGNDLTVDACNNTGSCGASCSNTWCDIACESDADCDDGDASTTDTCTGASTCSAACENTTAAQTSCSIELDAVNYAAGDKMSVTFTASNAGGEDYDCGVKTFLKRDRDTTVWFSFDDKFFVTVPAGGSVLETLYYYVPEEWVETDSPEGSDYGMEPVDRTGADLGDGDNFNIK